MDDDEDDTDYDIMPDLCGIPHYDSDDENEVSYQYIQICKKYIINLYYIYFLGGR